MKDEQQIRRDSEQGSDPRIHLSVERTRLAMERTQLAWVRTVMALMTAGVAIDKGFAALHEARLISGVAWVKNGHLAGQVLTIAGTALMIIVTVIFISRMGELNTMRGRRSRVPEPGAILSVLICLVGALAVYFLNVDW